MAMNGVKMEDDMHIKSDPETSPPTGFMDDDDYEDTGELSLPTEPPQLWLTRIPKWLWESLANAGDEDEIEIGKIRVYEGPTQDIKLFLNSEAIKNRDIPKEYDLTVNQKHPQDHPTNIYIFSEKDLPGYKAGAFGRGKMNQGPQDSKSGSYRVQKPRQRRRAIPKQTALIGAPNHEVNVVAVENADYRRFMEERSRRANEGAHRRTVVTTQNRPSGTESVDMSFGMSFRRGTQPVKARSQANKAARMPENELIDLLHRCFQEYRHWSLSSLKARTNQPEAYLREVLNNIAFLPKSGPFNGLWQLNTDVQGEIPADMDDEDVKRTIAPEFDGGDNDGNDDDDDAELEMEDAL